MSQPFLLADEGQLMCPLCSGTYVHIDDVYVAGRPREDGPVVPVHVNAGGRIATEEGVDLPMTDYGRRHVISLGGVCELCGGRFALEFKQHKGQTLVTIRKPVWTEVDAPAG
ncbi:hypothetical protein [Cellulomonas phragmiteti]|uniref:Uncharacterized protein n=1 Tax=Cellulomonas phragmiteti TaxID=478780 RepID=A0ABQ4DNN7_9CELL|nr:hypothetical protein [Cellulomonas phragmiteti]GIG40959.1 hypothetical protein Cph01nite_27210 [Cellulomonas phragmiteti]